MKNVRAASLGIGQDLVRSLSGGWQPTPIVPPFHMPPSESCYSTHQVQLLRMLEGDATYTRRSAKGFGAMGLTAVVATAVGNAARKRRAEQQAVAHFRPVDQGSLYVTSQRFALQGGTRWTDIWYSDVRMSYCDGEAVVLELSSSTPVQLRTWPAFAVFVLFRYLAHGEIVQL